MYCILFQLGGTLNKKRNFSRHHRKEHPSVNSLHGGLPEPRESRRGTDAPLSIHPSSIDFIAVIENAEVWRIDKPRVIVSRGARARGAVP
uniref:Uncharacterized protein n=1 Tax=Timema bartmani TaxID=61472 RepID=A0A7R9HVG7_9NEOP|nr:unnamed protein product [Timema bartmani]